MSSFPPIYFHQQWNPSAALAFINAFIYSFSARATSISGHREVYPRVQPKAFYTGRFAQVHWLLREAVTPSPAQSLTFLSVVLNLHFSDPLTACNRCALRSRYTSIFRSDHAHRHHFETDSVGTDLEWRALWEL
jgi:hypothetical protein